MNRGKSYAAASKMLGVNSSESNKRSSVKPPNQATDYSNLVFKGKLNPKMGN